MSTYREYLEHQNRQLMSKDEKIERRNIDAIRRILAPKPAAQPAVIPEAVPEPVLEAAPAAAPVQKKGKR